MSERSYLEKKLFKTFHHDRRYVNRQLTSLWLLLLGTGTTHISGVSSVYWHLDKPLKTASVHAFNVLQCIPSGPGTLWGLIYLKIDLASFIEVTVSAFLSDKKGFKWSTNFRSVRGERTGMFSPGNRNEEHLFFNLFCCCCITTSTTCQSDSSGIARVQLWHYLQMVNKEKSLASQHDS